MKHAANHDEVKTQRQLCACGHRNYQHEVHPNRHCYIFGCNCRAFRRVRKVPERYQ